MKTCMTQIFVAQCLARYWSEAYRVEPTRRNRRKRAEARRCLKDLMVMRNGEIRKNESQSKESFV